MSDRKKIWEYEGYWYILPDGWDFPLSLYSTEIDACNLLAELDSVASLRSECERLRAGCEAAREVLAPFAEHISHYALMESTNLDIPVWNMPNDPAPVNLRHCVDAAAVLEKLAALLGRQE